MGIGNRGARGWRDVVSAAKGAQAHGFGPGGAGKNTYPVLREPPSGYCTRRRRTDFSGTTAPSVGVAGREVRTRSEKGRVLEVAESPGGPLDPKMVCLEPS